MNEYTLEGDIRECEKRWWYAGKDGKPCLPGAPKSEPDLLRLARFRYAGEDSLHDPVEAMLPYGRIMELMVDVMGNEEARRLGITFGMALDRICERLGVPRHGMPQEIESATPTTTLQIVGSGRIPGAADAG